MEGGVEASWGRRNGDMRREGSREGERLGVVWRGMKEREREYW